MERKIKCAFLTEKTAGKVAQILKSVYENIYPRLDLPTAEKAWQEHISKKHFIALAFVGDKAIGMLSLRQASFNAKVYELGMLSIQKEYRRTQAASELLKFAKCNFAQQIAYDVVYLENVASHYFSQRKASANRAVDCAIALGGMPSFLEPTKRLSYIVSFLENPASQPEAIYLPRRYADILLFYYQGLLKRQIFPFAGDVVATTTQVDVTELATLSLLKFNILQIGQDFEDVVKKWYEYAAKQKTQTMQFYLPLNSAGIDYGVNILAAQGCFIGGIYPFWFGSDALMLQKVLPENLEPLKIYSSKAKMLYNLLRTDARGKFSLN